MPEALLALDPRVLVAGAIVVLVLLATAIIVVVSAGQFGPRAKFKRRMSAVVGKQVARSGERASASDASRRRDIQEKLKQVEEGHRTKRRRRYQIRQDLQQAGLGITVRQYAIGSAVLGVFGLVVILVLGFKWYVGVLTGVFLGLGIPKFWLGYMRNRRLKSFIKLFPEAIDIIVRGVQTGLPVGECLAIIGRETSDPIGGEFRQIVEGLQIGLTLEESLSRAQERLPTQELRFFAIVLQIQQQTGGNLAETLNNLSTVLRDRKKMKAKVSAMAAEANASASIIGSLPFVVCGLLLLINPNYLTPLFTDTTGQILVAIGLTWMSLGVFVMRQMINFEI